MDSPEEVRRIISDLDDFVETDITFDELTEFILDSARTVRNRADLTVPDAIRVAMEGYRATSRERYAQYGEQGPPADPVRDSMSR